MLNLQANGSRVTAELSNPKPKGLIGGWRGGWGIRCGSTSLCITQYLCLFSVSFQISFVWLDASAIWDQGSVFLRFMHARPLSVEWNITKNAINQSHVTESWGDWEQDNWEQDNWGGQFPQFTINLSFLIPMSMTKVMDSTFVYANVISSVQLLLSQKINFFVRTSIFN